MRTLQEIKDEFGVSKGFKDWEDFCICFFGAHIADSLDELFVKVAKEALKNAAENFDHCNCLEAGEHCDVEAHLEELVSENNIPKI